MPLPGVSRSWLVSPVPPFPRDIISRRKQSHTGCQLSETMRSSADLSRWPSAWRGAPIHEPKTLLREGAGLVKSDGADAPEPGPDGRVTDEHAESPETRHRQFVEKGSATPEAQGQDDHQDRMKTCNPGE